jgi:hypothetical protein
MNAMQQWGCDRYGFLGGDYDYKKRMSNKILKMNRTRIKRPSTKYKLEAFLKGFKQRYEGSHQHA